MTDLFNLTLAESPGKVDQINKTFYGRFNYPWPPSILLAYPAGISHLFLNQSTGQDPVFVGDTLHYEIGVGSGGPDNAFMVFRFLCL